MKQIFRKTVSCFCGLSIVFAPMMQQALAQQIITDGRSQTTVKTSGGVTDVTTTTVQGSVGYNSFKRFNVSSGNTVNLHIPRQADKLINIVSDEKTQIHGILNTIKNGAVGGDVYILNPHGVLVGESGVVNTGRMTMATPDAAFVESLLDGHGAISQAHVD